MIEFFESSEARAAFSSLAYTRFKNGPLYLEWAPADALGEAVVKKQDDETGQSGATPRLARGGVVIIDYLAMVDRSRSCEGVDANLFVSCRLCCSCF